MLRIFIILFTLSSVKANNDKTSNSNSSNTEQISEANNLKKTVSKKKIFWWGLGAFLVVGLVAFAAPLAITALTAATTTTTEASTIAIALETASGAFLGFQAGGLAGSIMGPAGSTVGSIVGGILGGAGGFTLASAPVVVPAAPVITAAVVAKAAIIGVAGGVAAGGVAAGGAYLHESEKVEEYNSNADHEDILNANQQALKDIDNLRQNEINEVEAHYCTMKHLEEKLKKLIEEGKAKLNVSTEENKEALKISIKNDKAKLKNLDNPDQGRLNSLIKTEKLNIDRKEKLQKEVMKFLRDIQYILNAKKGSDEYRLKISRTIDDTNKLNSCIEGNIQISHEKIRHLQSELINCA